MHGFVGSINPLPENKERCFYCSQLRPMSEIITLNRHGLIMFHGCQDCMGMRLLKYDVVLDQNNTLQALLKRARVALTVPASYEEIGALCDEIERAL